MEHQKQPWWIDRIFETEEELYSFFDSIGADDAYIEEWVTEAYVRERETGEVESK